MARSIGSLIKKNHEGQIIIEFLVSVVLLISFLVIATEIINNKNETSYRHLLTKSYNKKETSNE